MSGKSKIEWTDATWTPVRARVRTDAREIAQAKGYSSLLPILERIPAGKVGPHCEHVSPGCENCYSETNNSRCLPTNGTGLPFDRRARDLVEIFLDEKILLQPLRWRAPKLIFVNSQTDTFGEFVPDYFLDQMMAVASLCPHHKFLFLTKRARRMREYLAGDCLQARIASCQWGVIEARVDPNDRRSDDIRATALDPDEDWPLPNCWLGVSAEDQPRLDERAPELLRTPAAVRFLSLEPLLGEIDVARFLRRQGVDWVIVGGESGPGARPMHPDWPRSLRDQCIAAGVPFFFKQWGEWRPLTRSDGIHESPFGGQTPIRVGKKRAGRLLDGREWNEMPGAVA